MSGVNCHTKTGKSGNTGLVKSPEVLAKASRAREAVTSCCLLKQRGRAEEADAAHTVRKHHAVLRSAQRRTMRAKNAVSATGLPMLSSSRSAWKTQRVVGSSPLKTKEYKPMAEALPSEACSCWRTKQQVALRERAMGCHILSPVVPRGVIPLCPRGQSRLQWSPDTRCHE
jgi:hypothetical protein